MKPIKCQLQIIKLVKSQVGHTIMDYVADFPSISSAENYIKIVKDKDVIYHSITKKEQIHD